MFLTLVLLSVLLPAGAQQHCRVVFYNVENLFDTRDDPKTDDDEFTPWGNKHWTEGRYLDKLLKLAQALEGAGGNELPIVVGLAEVENMRVVDDLAQKTLLAGGDYVVVHRDSPDKRGIDVAFLYRKEYFKLLKSDFFPILFPENAMITTRDVLYVSGVVGDRDTLHFFVCHFPSMVGGEVPSEWKRKRVASVVRMKVDSIRSVCANANIVIMGDLNGKANTDAQVNVLKTRNSGGKIFSENLYNTGYYLLKKGYGSYRYQGVWQTIDHIIVSGSLLSGESGLKATKRLSIFSASFLLEEDKKFFGYRPRPTYRGRQYVGGYSDHLPVVLEIERRKSGEK